MIYTEDYDFEMLYRLYAWAFLTYLCFTYSLEYIYIYKEDIWIFETGKLMIYIIIIIMSCRQHRYPKPSLVTSPYRSSLLAGLQGYIPYPQLAAVCMFELAVLLLLGHMRGSIGVHQLWARPCFSSSVLHVWFV